MVDGVVDAWLGEVLDVDRPGVMVAFEWEPWDLAIRSYLPPHLSDSLSVVSDLFIGVVPDVVSRVIAGPGDEVGFEGVLILVDELKHGLQGPAGQVAEVVSPVACRARLGLGGWPGAAAYWELANVGCPSLVLEVNVQVREVD